MKTDLRCRGIVQTCSALGAATGTLVLFGWFLKIPALTSIIPGGATMKPITATCFFLSGVALWLLRKESAYSRPGLFRTNDPGQRRSAGFSGVRLVAHSCAALVMSMGTLTLAQYFYGWNFGIDTLLFHQAVTAAHAEFPGRMSGSTAFAFSTLGMALLMLDCRWPARVSISELCSLATIGLGGMGLIGYCYSVHSLYRFSPYSSMALHTALLFVLLGAGTLFVRPDRGMMAVVNSPHPGGWLARWLIPADILFALTLGWIEQTGERAGWYDHEIATAVTVTFDIGFFVGLAWIAGAGLNHLDIKRRHAEEELRSANADLELRVATRTAELASAHTGLQNVLDAATGVSIIATDPTGLITVFNYGAKRIIGY